MTKTDQLVNFLVFGPIVLLVVVFLFLFVALPLIGLFLATYPLILSDKDFCKDAGVRFLFGR
jgi:hypothetical protein